MKLTRTRATAAAVSTVFNVGLIALVMRTGAEAPPVWDETVVIAELVQVRGGETHAPSQSAQAPSSPPREPAPAPTAQTQSPPQMTPETPRPAAQTAAAPSVPASAPASAPAASASLATAQRASTPPQRAGTREGLDIDAPSGASMDYASRLRAWLEAHKTYPKRARMRREEGVVHLHFTMDRAGNVLSARIARTSGHAALDQETLELARRASPLPAPPEDLAGNPLSLTVPVRFSLR